MNAITDHEWMRSFGVKRILDSPGAPGERSVDAPPNIIHRAGVRDAFEPPADARYGARVALRIRALRDILVRPERMSREGASMSYER